MAEPVAVAEFAEAPIPGRAASGSLDAVSEGMPP